jgi:hypothetical protein
MNIMIYVVFLIVACILLGFSIGFRFGEKEKNASKEVEDFQRPQLCKCDSKIIKPFSFKIEIPVYIQNQEEEVINNYILQKLFSILKGTNIRDFASCTYKVSPEEVSFTGKILYIEPDSLNFDISPEIATLPKYCNS